MSEQKLTTEQKQLALKTVLIDKQSYYDQALATASFYQDKIKEASQQAFKEVGEWLEKECSSPREHDFVGQRCNCPECIESLISSLKQGKLE
jgi:hypothetical protein